MLRYTLVKARRAEDVEDLLQCTYARFYERICRRGHTDIESARAYLVTLLHRGAGALLPLLCKPQGGRAARRAAGRARRGGRPATRRSMLDEVWDCVHEMPRLTQKAFLLYYGFDQPVARIARTLALSETAVKNRLYRARALLRARLGATDAQERDAGAGRTGPQGRPCLNSPARSGGKETRHEKRQENRHDERQQIR